MFKLLLTSAFFFSIISIVLYFVYDIFYIKRQFPSMKTIVIGSISCIATVLIVLFNL